MKRDLRKFSFFLAETLALTLVLAGLWVYLGFRLHREVSYGSASVYGFFAAFYGLLFGNVTSVILSGKTVNELAKKKLSRLRRT